MSLVSNWGIFFVSFFDVAILRNKIQKHLRKCEKTGSSISLLPKGKQIAFWKTLKHSFWNVLKLLKGSIVKLHLSMLTCLLLPDDNDWKSPHF